MFWNVYSSLCSSNDTSPSAVAIAIGLSNSIATKWKNGAYPSGDILVKLSEYFNVSVDYLLGLDTEPNRKIQLSEDKQRLLKMYDLLTDMEKGEILGELKMLTRDIPMAAAARSTDNSIPTKPNIDNLDDIPTMDEE